MKTIEKAIEQTLVNRVKVIGDGEQTYTGYPAQLISELEIAVHAAMIAAVVRRQAEPRVVCLCGSTKFKEAFIEAAKQETLAGRIVLSVGFFHHREDDVIYPELKEKLDELHKRKIDLADEILVINVDGYVGDSTASEIAYAALNTKVIRWLDPGNIDEAEWKAGRALAEMMKKEEK